MLKKEKFKKLEKETFDIRKKSIEMAVRAETGHLGPALSIVDILWILYSRVMNYDPKNPEWSERDRLIISKGHGCIALYVTLAKAGFFDENILKTFCNRFDTSLGGHPERRLPGVEANTGSLGHGFNIGIGMAIAAKTDNLNYKVYSILGDGENQEGTIWEGAMAAAHNKLDNLVAIVDRNRLQVSDFVNNVMDIEPLKDKWASFGWGVKVVDGHDLNKLDEVFNSVPFKKG
ncbi:MAG: transketolase, partial [bacterium]